MKRICIIEREPSSARDIELVAKSLGHKVIGKYSEIPSEDKLSASDVIFISGEVQGGDLDEWAQRMVDSEERFVVFLTPKRKEEGVDVTGPYEYLAKPIQKVDLHVLFKALELKEQFKIKFKSLYQSRLKKNRLLAIGEVAGGLIHDLNNINFILKGSLEKVHELLSDFKKEHLKKIEECVARGLRASAYLEKLNRRYRILLKSGKEEERRSLFFVDLVDEACQYFDFKLSENGIKVYNEVSPSCRLQMNDTVITQTLVNLIANSINALKDFPGERWIKFTCEVLQHKTILRVIDSGNGIEKAREQSLFDQLEGRDASSAEGLGLGLSFIREQLQNEKVELQHDYSAQNTTFVLVFQHS